MNKTAESHSILKIIFKYIILLIIPGKLSRNFSTVTFYFAGMKYSYSNPEHFTVRFLFRKEASQSFRNRTYLLQKNKNHFEDQIDWHTQLLFPVLTSLLLETRALKVNVLWSVFGEVHAWLFLQVYAVPFLTAKELPKDHHYIYLITAFKNVCFPDILQNEEFHNVIRSQRIFSVLSFISLNTNSIILELTLLPKSKGFYKG